MGSLRATWTFLIVVYGLWLTGPSGLRGQGLPVSDGMTILPSTRHFTRLSIRDGLSQKDVYAILQDRRGFMWFGTRHGLNRYDGYTFTVYRNAPFDSVSLSDNWVLALWEDRSEGLWVGTLRGLNRLDPVTGRVVRYLHDPGDAHSLSHDLVWAVYEDRGGTLWVGTEGGLNRLDRSSGGSTGRFTRYTHDPEDPYSLSSERVYALHEDRRGRLWVSTANGLNRLDRSTGRFTRYLYNPQLSGEQRDDILYGIAAAPEARPYVIRGLCDDPNDPDILWVSTEGGLLRFDAASGEARSYLPDSVDADHNVVMDVVPDPAEEGLLWLATNGGGLYHLDTRRGHFLAYRHDPYDPASIGSDKLNPLFVDRTGMIWAGSFGHGVQTFQPALGGFAWYRHQPGQANSLTHADVWTVREDHTGALWIGTNAGLNRLDRETGTYTHFFHDPQDPYTLSSSNINYVFEDRSQTLWVGTYGGGLNRLDPSTGRFIHYRYDPEDSTSLGSDFVSYLYEDRDGAFWVGTWGAGLQALDRAGGRFTRYRHDPTDTTSISDDRILDIYEDTSGRLWVGTYDGLNRFDQATGRFIRYRYDIAVKDGLSHPGVYSMHERAREPGVLWLATPGGGLNRFDTRTDTFTHFTEQDGLSNNRVLGILEDDAGRLWMGTANGLSRFDPERSTFHTYGLSSGLQVKEFNPLAYFKSRRGELFFGGIDGLQSFFPDQIAEDPTAPQVVLTGLKLLNEPVAVEAGGVLSQPLARMEELRLDHRQKVITFEFVALHYLNPEENQYAYRLDGFDEGWVMAGSQRSATYTNLHPGTYVFRVKAANRDGVWNEEGASVRLVILPPFWRTTWFYALCLAGLLAVAYFGYRARIRNLSALARALETLVGERTRALVAEKKKTEEQARRLLAIDEAKNRFFANISHEFRTPLTLINGSLEDLLSDDPDDSASEHHAEYRLMLRSGRRLLRLVNQLLDLARIESGRLELRRKPGDFAGFLRDLAGAFVPLAERRKIILRYHLDPEILPLAFDADKMEKVFSNLLSNALKFTPEGGKVWVTLSTRWIDGEPVAEVVVKDTGPGIPREDVPRIFDRFEKGAGAQTQPQTGTGIGLALARELVVQHEGRIMVESEPGFGSAFIVHLPLDAGAPAAQAPGGDGQDETGGPTGLIQSVALEEAVVREEDVVRAGVDPPGLRVSTVSPEERTATILVVEDHAEVRAFLRKHLGSSYRVLEAVDGAAGLEMARRNLPDLLLCDVMMPGMDGYALCRAVKADERLCTIPVVLLTAKAGEQEVVRGLESGADGYIVKPFHVGELKARVAAWIRASRRARHRFGREIIVQPTGVTIRPEDEVFLERVLAVVEAHLGDRTFTAGAMARAVGLSRRQFERRVKQVAGETPAELLRRMRLERARRLLKTPGGTIAEVAYAVGYKSPAHFSKAFRRAFGVSPSVYSENAS